MISFEHSAPYSSGLQLKDVMKLTESSSEHVSELFKSALSAMTVTETHEEARAIAGNRTTVENVSRFLFHACVGDVKLVLLPTNIRP